MAKHATYEIVYNASVFDAGYAKGIPRREFSSVEELNEGITLFLSEFPFPDDEHGETMDFFIRRTTRDDSIVD